MHNKNKKHKKHKKQKHKNVTRQRCARVLDSCNKIKYIFKIEKMEINSYFFIYFVLYVLRSFTLSVLYYIPRPIIIGNILMCTHVATLPQD